MEGNKQPQKRTMARQGKGFFTNGGAAAAEDSPGEAAVVELLDGAVGIFARGWRMENAAAANSPGEAAVAELLDGAVGSRWQDFRNGREAFLFANGEC